MMTIRILIGVTGSVATVKIVQLIRELFQRIDASSLQTEICVIATDSAMHFIPGECLAQRENTTYENIDNTRQACSSISIASKRILVLSYLSKQKEENVTCHIPLYTCQDEWKSWNQLGDPILHVVLSKWANIFLIAPLDANTLAKIAHGFCDNLLSCVIRAIRFDQKRRIFLCPAMNTSMWEHPLTTQHINTLITPPMDVFNYTIIYPIVKKLACQDTGLGAMADVSTIVDTVTMNLEEI